MELTPQLLTDEIDFRIAVRGYDRHEVDDFLERVAVAVGQLQSQLTKAVDRAKKAEASLADRADGAPASAAEVDETPVASTEPAADEAAGRSVTAPPPAAPAPVAVDDDDLNDELRRTLVLAQRTADMAIREAREEAGGIVAEANREADRIRAGVAAEAEEAREEARGRLIAEIRELERTRETMRSDTEVLDRYLGTERARVRETIQVLRRLVDEPERFRPAAAPELSPVTLPRELSAAPDEAPTAEAAEASAGEQEPVADEAPVSPARDTADDGTDTSATPPDATPDAEPVADDASAVDVSDPAGAPAGDDAETPQHERDGTADAGETTDAVDEAAPGGSEHLDRLFDTGDGQRDWRSGGADRGDQGPHTQPVAAARFEEESDEAFLAELRRAMSDDEPLGPDAED